MTRVVGLFAMYMIFLILGVLVYSSISKSFFDPSLWTLEVAQFTMVAYYLLGGGYTLMKGDHVRMDLHNETSRSIWGPKIAPIKLVMVIGIILTLLQAFSLFFKSLAIATGKDIA